MNPTKANTGGKSQPHARPLACSLNSRKSRLESRTAPPKGPVPIADALIAFIYFHQLQKLLMIFLSRALMLSMALVTGMMPPGASASPPFAAYGSPIRDRGTGGARSVGRPIYMMSRELELVAGRPCDPPGCAARANP